MQDLGESLLVDPKWEYLSTVCDKPANVSQYCPRQPYLSLIMPLSNLPTRTIFVHRLQFTTVSHDQGYSSDPNNHGTYKGTHTYFDFRVKEPTGHDRTKRRTFAQNIRACLQPKKHVTCWVTDQTSRSSAQHNAISLEDDSTWLSAIRCGDTVQIIPMAEYPGWINFVLEARIEVWFQMIDRVAPGLALGRSCSGVSIYRKLDRLRKEIRLVAIEPSSDLDSGNLELSLRHTYLTRDDHVQYEALSYCWGDGYNQHSILLSEPEHSPPATTISISENLFLALKALRRERARRVIWVDQLCINQADLRERGEQVALMGDIYTSAEHVRIWLGALDQEVSDDFATFQSISNVYSQTKVPQEGLCASRPEENSHITAQDSHKIIRGPQAIDMHNDRVFDRPWFERVWVLQEVWTTPVNCTAWELSQRATVMCGSAEVPLALIMQADQCLRSHNASRYNALMPAIWTTLFNPPAGSDYVARDCIAFMPRPRLDILTVLISALEMRATDARDKLFALLIFGEETHRLADLPDSIKPDYSKSVRRVYIDFTRWWICHHRSLRIISAVHALTGHTWLDMSPGQMSDAEDGAGSCRPSWSFWSDGRSEWRRATLGTGDSRTYDASRGREVDVCLLASAVPSQAHVLALKGVRIGVICSTAYYPFHRRPLISEAMHQVYGKIFDPASTVGTWGHTKTLAHLPVLDQGQLPYHYFSHWREVSRDSLDSSAGQTDPDAPDYLPCHGKCMFFTERSAGLCPNGSRSGDIVVILFGADVPHILRRGSVPGQYCLVGECYLENAMHGEVFGEKVMPTEETFLIV